MSAREWRDNLLAYLETVADPARQLAWERDEKVAHVPWELVNEWLDLYHPEAEMFREAFTPQELERLQQFHLALESALPQIPDASVAAMLASEAWQRVMAAAKPLLHFIRQ